MVFSLALLWAGSLQADSKIANLEKSIKLFRPFQCKFTQDFYDAFQEKTTRAIGTMMFMQPALMKWSYEQPEEMLLVIGKEKMWLYDPILENVTIQPLHEVSGIRSLRFLSGDEQISKHFNEIVPTKIRLDLKKGLTAVFLAPAQKNQALSELQILYDNRTHQLHQFVLIDHNANYRKLTFNDISLRPESKASEFEFIVKENMEIIQGISN